MPYEVVTYLYAMNSDGQPIEGSDLETAGPPPPPIVGFYNLDIVCIC